MSESAKESRNQPRAQPKKKKTEQSDQAVPVNKSFEIRKVARRMVSQGKPPRPIAIIASLKRAGIAVTSAQVSTALANTEFAFRRNRDGWERPQAMFPDPALAFGQVSIDDVIRAKKFVADLGTIEKAMAALVALKQFGGEQPRGEASRTEREECRVVPEKKAKSKASDESAPAPAPAE